MTTRLKPNCPPIASIESLAGKLQISGDHLTDVAVNSASHWRPGPKKKKPNGEIRKTSSATSELKFIHKRINSEILSQTYYPNYLFGGIPKNEEGGHRNHIANAELHAGTRLIISADIKGFYPSVDALIVHNIWKSFYCFAPNIADLLTMLTTYDNQLTQGWGSSSYLSQLAFWQNEHEVVEHFHAHSINYSRYVDDITLSTNQTLTGSEVTQLLGTITSMLGSIGTRLNRDKTSVDSRFRRQSVNKLNVANGKLTLHKNYRKTLRARVHNLVTQPEQFESSLSKEIKSVKGQISYLSTFHQRDARNLLNQVNELQKNL